MFITFEGGEGSGKSVQSRRLYQHLMKEGFPALLTHEPGGTPLGQAITRWLKWHLDSPISAATETLLFNSSRSHLVSKVIKPAIEEGKVVICDRYCDSTLVYQGYARGLDVQLIECINKIATGGLKPNITFLLDIVPKNGLGRKSKTKADRFEREAASFHNKVRHGYLALAHAEPARWCILNAARPRGEIAEVIWEKVSRSLRCRGA